MNNISTNMPTSFSASLASTIIAGTISLSIFTSNINQREYTVPNIPVSEIAHTLAKLQYSYEPKPIIEKEMLQFVNNVITSQVAVDLEIDKIIVDNLWELYQHGFSEDA